MDGQAMIDTAEGAHLEIVNLLQRMREIAVQASNDTNDSTDRNNLRLNITPWLMKLIELQQLHHGQAKHC
jgi:flagellin